MKDRLQPFDFDRSSYERPDARWVCGRKLEGLPCREGPDGRGRCSLELATCQPSSDQACGRSAERGGPCSEGPDAAGRCGLGVPCLPRRSLRSLRGLLTRACCLLLVAALAAVLASPRLRAGFVSPGALSHAHVAVASDCAACHHAADQSWLAEGADDSERCLACHNLGPHPIQPHGLAAPKLAQLSAAAAQRPGTEGPWDLTLARGFRGVASGEQGCATCHREHQGAGHDLRAMAAERCQACHQQTFAAFDAGHPEFRQLGQMRAPGIRFAHASHLLGGPRPSHFASKGEAPLSLEASCTSCHLASPDGRDVLLRGYEASCARCHDGDFETRLGAQRLISFPSFSVQGLGAGSWPFHAPAVGEVAYDATPWMRLLLAGDRAAAGLPQDILELARALHTVRCSADVEHFSRVEADPKRVQRMLSKPCRTCQEPLIYTLDHAEPALRRQARSYVYAVRRLFDDLLAACDGRIAGLRERLEAVAGRTLPEQTLRAWAAALPGPALRAARRRWLPQPWYRMKMLAGPLDLDAAALEQVLEVGAWQLSELGLSWRPGHADPLLASSLRLAGALGMPGSGAAGTAIPSLLAALDVCAKCHSQQEEPEGFGFAWRARASDARQRRFTRFSHAPHTDFPEHRTPAGTACLSCHHLAMAEPVEPPLSEVGLHDFHRRSICANCHTSDTEHNTGAAFEAQCAGCAATMRPGERAFACQECGRLHHQRCLVDAGCAACGQRQLHLRSAGARHRGPTDCLTCHSYHVGLRQTDWEVSHE